MTDYENQNFSVPLIVGFGLEGPQLPKLFFWPILLALTSFLQYMQEKPNVFFEKSERFPYINGFPYWFVTISKQF